MPLQFWAFKNGQRVDLGCNRWAAPRLAREAGFALSEVHGFNPNNGESFKL